MPRHVNKNIYFLCLYDARFLFIILVVHLDEVIDVVTHALRHIVYLWVRVKCKHLKLTSVELRQHARDLAFEDAARVRDQIRRLREASL